MSPERRYEFPYEPVHHEKERLHVLAPLHGPPLPARQAPRERQAPRPMEPYPHAVRHKLR